MRRDDMDDAMRVMRILEAMKTPWMLRIEVDEMRMMRIEW